MRDSNKFRGVGVAVVTPFNSEGKVDYLALERLIDDIICNHIDYLVLLGTTGETPNISHDERQEIVRTAVRVNAKRVPIVVGFGGPSTHLVVEQLSNFDFTGVDAILSVTPFYNRPTQQGLIEHFTTIAYHSPLPIILYSIKGRTGCNIDIETVLQLAENEKFIGIKEASGNMNQIMGLIKKTPEDFVVISGDDAITLPLLAAGADGVISVVANAYPAEISEMVHLAMENKFVEARQYHLSMLDITQACFKEGNPAGIKTFLSVQGKIDYYLRLPLTRVSETHQAYIKRLATEMRTQGIEHLRKLPKEQ